MREFALGAETKLKYVSGISENFLLDSGYFVWQNKKGLSICKSIIRKCECRYYLFGFELLPPSLFVQRICLAPTSAMFNGLSLNVCNLPFVGSKTMIGGMNSKFLR